MADPVVESTDFRDNGRSPWNRSSQWLIATLALRAKKLSPTRWSQLVSLGVLLTGMFGLGGWLKDKTAEKLLQDQVAINSVYITSFVGPLLQDLERMPVLPAEAVVAMDRVLTATPLGQHMAACIVWSIDNKVLYSSSPSQIGWVYPPDDALSDAYAGRVAWELADAQAEAHTPTQSKSKMLLAIYNPVRAGKDNRVVAVVEFYESADPLLADLASAQRQIWLVIGLITFSTYLLLALLIEQASQGFARQRAELGAQVVRLRGQLARSGEQRKRMRWASHRAAVSIERLRHSIRDELTNGPAQYLGAALLYLDRVAEFHETHPEPSAGGHVALIQSALLQAIRELQSISTELDLPQLEQLSISQVAEIVIRAHGQRSPPIALVVESLPGDVDLSIKIMLYRVIQVWLESSESQHAFARQVALSGNDEALLIELSGVVADPRDALNDNRQPQQAFADVLNHIESMGGRSMIQPAIDQGGRLCIELPLPRFTSEHTE